MPISPRKVWKTQLSGWALVACTFVLCTASSRCMRITDPGENETTDCAGSSSNTRAFMHEMRHCYASLSDRCVYTENLHQHVHIASCVCTVFPVQGAIELSITLGYVLGAPIGGGLQEVRELRLSSCIEIYLVDKEWFKNVYYWHRHTLLLYTWHTHSIASSSCKLLCLPLYYRLVGSYFPLSWWVALLLSGCSFWWC